MDLTVVSYGVKMVSEILYFFPLSFTPCLGYDWPQETISWQYIFQYTLVVVLPRMPE